jgi:hypothetical protein
MNTNVRLTNVDTLGDEVLQLLLLKRGRTVEVPDDDNVDGNVRVQRWNASVDGPDEKLEDFVF